MSLLPRVTGKARELVSREFDTRGPDVCLAEVIEHLERHNPELLDMAAKCAAELENPAKVMVGFGVFYRLLIGPLPVVAGARVLTPLPRVSVETRAQLVAEIDDKGSETFTTEAIAELENGTVARTLLGDEVVDHYLNYARTEQELFDKVVTNYERERMFERG